MKYWRETEFTLSEEYEYEEGDEDIKYEDNQTKKTTMSIVKFAKSLALSKSEKLLRKYGLKDDCGNYTEEAVEIVQQRLCADNEAELVKVAEAKDKEEK
jgi:hypothetical protein